MKRKLFKSKQLWWNLFEQDEFSLHTAKTRSNFKSELFGKNPKYIRTHLNWCVFIQLLYKIPVKHSLHHVITFVKCTFHVLVNMSCFGEHVMYWCHLSCIDVTCYVLVPHVMYWCHMSCIGATCHVFVSHVMHWCQMACIDAHVMHIGAHIIYIGEHGMYS